MRLTTLKDLVRQFLPLCSSAYPACKRTHLAAQLRTDWALDGVVCMAVCPACKRQRRFLVSGHRLRQVTVDPDKQMDLARDVVRGMTLPPIVPFGAGPATT